jgi:hypothetical protein
MPIGFATYHSNAPSYSLLARISHDSLQGSLVQGYSTSGLCPAVDTVLLRTPRFGNNSARNLSKEQIERYGQVTGVTRQISPEMTHYDADDSRDKLTTIGLRVFLGQGGSDLEQRRDRIDRDSETIYQSVARSSKPVVALQVVKYLDSSNGQAEVLRLNRDTINDLTKRHRQGDVYSVGFVPKPLLRGFPKTPTACFYLTNDPGIADELLENAYPCNRYFLHAK